MSDRNNPIRFAVAILLAASGVMRLGWAQDRSSKVQSLTDAALDHGAIDQFVTRYCADCHNATDNAGGLDLGAICKEEASKHSKTWEAVVRKLEARLMPPRDADRPSESQYNSMVAALEEQLDQAALAHSNPGRTDTFRRLNRTEYQNAIRDLLALDIDAADLLPTTIPVTALITWRWGIFRRR